MTFGSTAINKNFLAGILFLTIFMNGFEAGGYQACLLKIGQEFDLSASSMGLLASVQLFAILLAPLLFGALADWIGKRKVMAAFLLLRLGACIVLLTTLAARSFVLGIFVIGLSISILQAVAIAGLEDAYPLSGRKKLGIITSMYALGAVLAPLFCGVLLESGFSWRILFILVGSIAALLTAALCFVDFTPKENGQLHKEENSPSGKMLLSGILLLCFIMFVYVGVENGVAFFLTSFVQIELHGGADSYLALSMFWLAMIPSRLLCGAWHEKRASVLLTAAAGVSILAFLLSIVQDAGLAVFLSFVMGFFSGAVYPSVLNYSVDFASGRTATATGLITAATGLGGAVVAAAFGWVADYHGMRTAFDLLGAFMAIDIAAVGLLIYITRRRRK